MSTYAIIDLGGKQLRVEPGRFYDAHLFSSFKSLLSESNTKIIIFRVLMISHGTDVQFGYPWLKNAAVKARILHKKQNDKMLIYKMRSKKKRVKNLDIVKNLLVLLLMLFNIMDKHLLLI